jgi:hypothetical protein
MAATVPCSCFSVSPAPHHPLLTRPPYSPSAGGFTMASGQGAPISVWRLGRGRRRRRGDGPANWERAAPFLFPISRQRLHGIRAGRDLGGSSGGSDGVGVEAGRQAGREEVRYSRLDHGSAPDRALLYTPRGHRHP